MTSPIRLLLVEDSEDDRELILRALGDMGRPIVPEFAWSAETLLDALARARPDAVLSDFSMPGFSGQKALEIVMAMAPEVPFIFVSGTIGEELAIDAMQRGAADYVLKGNLKRLRPSLERALRSAQERRERREMESALRESDERFRAIVETTGDWIWQTDAGDLLTYSNDNTVKLIGLAPPQLIGRPRLELLVPEDRPAAERHWHDAAAAGGGWRNVIRRWRHADGGVRLLESTARPMLDASGTLIGFRGIERDVTLRVEQENRIEHLARMHAVLSAFGNAILRSRDIDALLDMTCRLLLEQGRFRVAGVCTLQPDGRLALANQAGSEAFVARAMPGREIDPTAPEHQGRAGVRALREGRTIVEDARTDPARPGWKELLAEFGLNLQVSTPIGSPCWGVLTVFTGVQREFNDEEVALLERLSSEIDYAREFIAQREQLKYIAYHNPTTGLPGRNSLQNLIAPRLARGSQVVAMADLKRFRYYNQSRGRAFGDALLREVAQRLRSLLPPGALFAHPGDDAFVFAYDAAGPIEHEASAVAALLARCCEKPFPVDGELVPIRMHGSVMLAPEHGRSGEEIERGLVDVIAEAQQRDVGVLAFTEEVRLRSTRRVQLENDLRSALEHERFELFLQPKFTCQTRELVGAEALLRWRHPERGLISPAEFVPVLEHTGLILEVGAWVREAGFAISSRWRELGRGRLRLAVNVSAQELRQLDLVDQMRDLVGSRGGEHGLDIEITESVLMDDIEQSIRALQAMRELGCRVAIDDFGTGYSSLNYLSRLPADTLKIDRSFVDLLTHSPDTVSLVSNIINLAHSLGLRIVAEGVEDEEQFKLLRLLRCDEMQGYLLGRPVPVAEFERTFLG